MNYTIIHIDAQGKEVLRVGILNSSIRAVSKFAKEDSERVPDREVIVSGAPINAIIEEAVESSIRIYWGGKRIHG